MRVAVFVVRAVDEPRANRDHDQADRDHDISVGGPEFLVDEHAAAGRVKRRGGGHRVISLIDFISNL